MFSHSARGEYPPLSFLRGCFFSIRDRGDDITAKKGAGVCEIVSAKTSTIEREAASESVGNSAGTDERMYEIKVDGEDAGTGADEG